MMKKNSNLFRLSASFALAALAALASGPALAQADLSKFVQVGDSLTAGYMENCWVEHGQRDSFGAIIARQAGTPDFQQPLMGEPGLGSGVGPGKGCMVLTSLAPTFKYKDSVLKPLNLTLARPYDNLGVPGFTVSDIVDTKAASQNGNPLTDLVLRGLGGGTTAVQQAASLKPTFLTLWIGNNDVLGAVSIGTVVDGVTLTSLAKFTDKFTQAIATLKAGQGGTGKGVVFTVPSVTAAPFATTIPPVIVVGGKPVIGPDGKPITYLGPRGPGGTPAPIPVDSLLTLPASAFLSSGFGIPCAVLDAGGVPPNSPLRANCNKPLPDSANAQAGTPGVILYPDELALLKTRTAEYNAAIRSIAGAAGYKVFDVGAWFDGVRANGVDIGGIVLTSSYLAGGLFSYDGIHATTIGYSVLANDVIAFINEQYGSSIPQQGMYQILMNGNTSPGGYPVGMAAPLSTDEVIAWGAEIFDAQMLETLRTLFPVNLPETVALDPTDQAPQVRAGKH